MASMQDTEANDFRELKELLSGPTLRRIIGIVDAGAVFLGVIKNADGGEPNAIHSKKRNVWTWVTDALTELPVLGRLYVPAGILWRKPKEGELAHVMRGRNQHSPGGPLVVPDGSDGATDDFVPPWFDNGEAGLFGPEIFHVESTKDKVVITANSGGTSASVTLNKDGSIDLAPAAGKTVNVAGSTYSAAKWDDFLTYFNTFLAALKVDLTAGSSGGCTTTSCASPITPATYKSQNAKNG